ncbi:hypothetical protein BH11PSE12_BH11PSE12_30880 [soil metagenome]
MGFIYCAVWYLKTGSASAHIPCAFSSTLACRPHGICVLAACCFCFAVAFYCLVLFIFLSLLWDCRPVVDRRLLPFLASPRKGSKRRRRKVAALRVPACASQKMGNEANSLRSNSFISNPFSAMHKRQRHMRKAKVNTSVVLSPLLRTSNAQAYQATAIRCCF